MSKVGDGGRESSNNSCISFADFYSKRCGEDELSWIHASPVFIQNNFKVSRVGKIKRFSEAVKATKRALIRESNPHECIIYPY